MIKFISRSVLAICICLLLFCALLASFGRYIAPYASDFRPQIVSWTNSVAPLSIDAKHLEGDWRRLSPGITVRGLQLGSGADALGIERARIKLNLAYSVWYRKLVFDELEIAGVSLDFLEDADGKWALDAKWLPKADKPSGLLSVESLYQGLEQLALKGARLQFNRHDGRVIIVDHLNMDYTKEGNQWRINSNGLPDKSALPINMIVEGIGLPGSQGFTAHAYSLVNGFDASPYLEKANYQGWKPELPRFDARLWLDYEQGKLEVQGVVDLKKIRFTHEDGRNSIDVPELASQFKFAIAENESPSIWLRDLHIRLKDEEIKFEQANLLPNASGLQASFDSINVKPVLRLLRRFEVLPDTAQDVLATLDPGGELRDITLRFPEQGGIKNLQISARLDQVSTRAWKGAPGVENLSGQIYATLKQGIVDIDSNDIELRFPKLFREPIGFARANGLIQWRIKDKTVEVESGLLDFGGKLGEAAAYLSLDIPLKKEYLLEPNMDLQIALEDTRARYRNTFIPYTLDEGLREWLERSVVSADISEAAFIYRGSIARNSGKKKSVQLYIDADDAELDYDPAWPAARDLKATVFVDDANVLVEASEARVSGLAMQSAVVRYVPAANLKGGTVKLKSSLNGELDAALELCRDSPIREQLGSALDDWAATGRISGRLSTDIPIGLDKSFSVDLRARLHEAQLDNEQINIQFNDVNGPLRYSSSKGLHSAGLVGTLWNDSLSAEIQSSKTPATESGGEAEWITSLNVRGTAAPDSVLSWLRTPLNDFLSGEIEYLAELNIRKNDTRLKINSRLLGLSSKLPPPFGKLDQQELPLGITLFLNERPLRMRLQLADRMNGALVLPPDQAMTGMLSFYDGPQPSYADDSIRLSGNLKRFDLGGTLDVIDAYRTEAESTSASDEPGSNDQGAPQPRKIPTVYAQDLKLEIAEVFGNEFEQVTAAVASHGEAWTFAFNSERVIGRATYDAAQSTALDISLDRLYLQTETNELGLDTAEQPSSDLLADFYPAELPEMQFKLADLRVNEKPYGQWSFSSSSIQHGIIFKNLTANSRGMQIAGTTEQPAYLRWRRVGDQQQTEFNGVLSCGDLGAVLEAWDYAAAIRSNSCRFGADLAWYGSPLDLELAGMEGKVDIALNNGQFLETNSTANALRIFSLFNFDTLLRRLQFRFDDVFNRGLSYDQITGGFALANGELDIERAFEVNGPSSRLQMTGSLDLLNETVDTRMVATLPISSNLPWVAALAGGLPMAAGVYVAGKIFQKPMEKLSSASYEVTGSWDEPDIKLQRIFDDDAGQTAAPEAANPDNQQREQGIDVPTPVDSSRLDAAPVGETTAVPEGT
ncbi:MAG: YhdP family protein [Pseudomonadales bacterium]